MSEEDIGSISCWVGEATNGDLITTTTISCWKLTAEELAEVNRTGRVWLGCMGATMQPAWISGHSPFIVEEKPIDPSSN